MINENIKYIITKIETFRSEEKNLIRFITNIPGHMDLSVLDVGCGYGRNIKLLNSLVNKIVGVDANEVIVKTIRKIGIDCLTVEEFENTSELYDVILMSHVIEHFHPDDLLKFMGYYLERLKNGGFLIIVTPLNSPYFFDDFDHIKPYSPVGISMVFGENNAQVKYYSNHTLDLIDLWFRRSPFMIINFKGRMLRCQYHIRAFNIVLNVLFRISFGLIGRCDGWMGLYQKKIVSHRT